MTADDDDEFVDIQEKVIFEHPADVEKSRNNYTYGWVVVAYMNFIYTYESYV